MLCRILKQRSPVTTKSEPVGTLDEGKENDNEQKQVTWDDLELDCVVKLEHDGAYLIPIRYIYLLTARHD